MALPPSGEQFEIAFAEQRATIVEVGAGVRAYSCDQRDVLQPYALDVVCDGAHGAPLLPWPNRLGDGRYRFNGSDQQVALTEPEKGNAIHGFTRWRSWQVRDRAADAVTLSTRLYPLMGYPFTLDLSVEYRLDEGGLTASTTATNVGEDPCPYAAGQHPYLSPGDALVDDCDLELAAQTRVMTDPERQLPTGSEAVAGTAFDFRARRAIGSTAIDFAFTDLARDSDGRAWVRLHAPDGRTVELWVDETYPLIELYTADQLSADRRRRGLGAEPMTCPPNGFQTGDGVITLEPGQSMTTAWGVRMT